VDNAHSDPHFRRLGREPGNQRHPLQKFASRGHRQGTRKPFHHSEGIPEFFAIGGLWDDDPVEGPYGVEFEFLGETGEVGEFAHGHFVAEVGQVKGEPHDEQPPSLFARKLTLVSDEAWDRLIWTLRRRSYEASARNHFTLRRGPQRMARMRRP